MGRVVTDRSGTGCSTNALIPQHATTATRAPNTIATIRNDRLLTRVARDASAKASTAATMWASVDIVSTLHGTTISVNPCYVDAKARFKT